LTVIRFKKNKTQTLVSYIVYIINSCMVL